MKIKLLTGFFCLLMSGPVWSQIDIRPLQRNNSNARTLRLQNLDTIRELPFFDEFSTSSGFPDQSRWYGNVVTVTPGKSINPPSLNAANFDGLNASNAPYNPDPRFTGLADSLVSQCIDLTILSPGQEDSVYLSFWYQLEGNVELPDEEDSLRLQFKSSEGEWYTFWMEPGADQGTAFEQVLIQVPDTMFHECFQFRFQSFGRLDGPVDAWHLDYVYLNQSRFAGDIGIPDRAITIPPSGIFDKFSTVPITHLVDEDTLMSTTLARSQIFNNDNNQITGFNFQAAVTTEYQGQTVTLDSIRPNAAFGGVPPFPFQRRELIADKPFDVNTLLNFLDTISDIPVGEGIELTTTFAISGTGDQEDFMGINFLVNDTARSVVKVADYYAYDDGSAEFEFGVSGSGTALAVSYTTEQRDTLTAIDIMFTTGELAAVTITVWDSIPSNTNEEVIATRSDNVLTGAFTRYTLPTNPPIIIDSLFSIGYEQRVDGFVYVGFDKDNDTRETIWIRADNSWVQDTDNVNGSLMIRPVFGTAGIITGIREDIRKQVSIYPVPANQHLNIEGAWDSYRLQDMTGRIISQGVPATPDGGQINTSGYPAGLYLLGLRKGNVSWTRKIIIQH